MASAEENPYIKARKPSTWPPLLVGVGAALVMLVPGWVTGGRVLIPGLFSARRGGFTLLPLDLGHVFSVFGMLVLGGMVAGLVVRMLRRRHPMKAWPAALGVLLVHVLVGAQSLLALAGGLAMAHATGSQQGLYFAGLLVVVVLGVLFAQLSVLLATRRSPAFAALGVALSAVLVANWIAAPLAVMTGYSMGPSLVLRWVPSVIVGVALIWCGVRPWGRLVVWVTGLGMLWVLPAVMTVLPYALNVPALQSDPQGLVYGIATQIVPVVLRQEAVSVAVALVIGVVGTVVRMLVTSRRVSPAATPSVA